MNPKQRILLAMSGGTDSSVAAILLLEQGYEVEGVTLLTWGENPAFVDDAASLARQLGIRHHVVDIRKSFEAQVFRYFLDEYQRGRTPNPCVVCNPLIKWATLAGKADEFGIRHIATGHYAKVEQINQTWYIAKGKDAQKDQSYFLWKLPQSILQRAHFPLGNLTKSEVRQIAIDHGFKSVAHKKESMGVCFLEGIGVNSFLQKHRPNVAKEGEIVNKTGDVLGFHQGVAFYTIGQKKGLDLSDVNGQCVVKIDGNANRLVIGDPESLWCHHLTLSDIYFADQSLIIPGKTYHVRIRGVDRVPFHEAYVDVDNEKITICFLQPVWAPTPGQSVVVYDDEIVLGGGILD